MRRLDPDPRHDDLRQGDRRAGRRTPSSTRSSRPAATWSTPPTSTPRGASEEIIGRWLAERPAGGPRPRRARHQGPVPDGRRTSTTSACPAGTSSARWTTRCAGSASRRVDLYQVHSWDPVTPLEETLGILDDFVRAGKVRYVGLSNYTGWQVQKTVALAESAGWPRPVTLQPQYNLLVRELEWEIVPSCLRRRPRAAALVAARRRLADRQVPAGRAPDRRHPARRGPRRAASRPTTGAPRSSAPGTSSTPSARSPTARGVSMAQVALAWLVDRPAVTSVILGARTTEQLTDNLGAAGLHLDEAETARLDAASDPGAGRLPVRRPGRAPARPHRRPGGLARGGTEVAPGHSGHRDGAVIGYYLRRPRLGDLRM